MGHLSASCWAQLGAQGRRQWTDQGASPEAATFHQGRRAAEEAGKEEAFLEGSRDLIARSRAAEEARTELPSFPPAPQSLVPFPGGRLHFLPLNMRLSSHKFSLLTWACASGASVLCG